MNSFNEYNIINFMKTECEQRPQPETLQPTAKDNCKLQQPPLHQEHISVTSLLYHVQEKKWAIIATDSKRIANCNCSLLFLHMRSKQRQKNCCWSVVLHQPTANLFMHRVQYQTFNHTKEGIASCLFCNYLEALCLQPCHRSRLYTNNAQLMIRSAG